MIAQALFEEGLKVSPFTPYVYGFLVVILMAAVVYMARLNWSLRKENERIRIEDNKYKEKSLELLVKAESRLPSAAKFEEIKGMIVNAISILTNIQNGKRCDNK